MSRVRTDGLQWMVHLLQKLQKNGAADYPVCCQAPIPRGRFSIQAEISLLTTHQLMAMNVVPRLVLDDA